MHKAKQAGSKVRQAGKNAVNSRGARMFGRNTIASTFSFLLDLAILVALVELAGLPRVPAAAIAFVIPLIIFYFLQREWVFKGTDRGVAEGFVYFLIIMGIGFTTMLTVFWTLLEFTEIHYVLARLIASAVHGIIVFVLNGMFNFKKL